MKKYNETFHEENFKALDSYESFITDLINKFFLDLKEIYSINKENSILRLDENIYSNNFRDKVTCNEKFKEIIRQKIGFYRYQ